jgi:two-component system sensor histidine kinase HydH
MRRPFNIRLWFALGGLGTIGLIAVLSAFWISHFLTNTLLEREAEVSQEFLESLAFTHGDQVFSGSNQPGLLEFARQITSMPGVIRVNIHSPDHVVLWSSESQLTGQRFEGNPELDEALEGKRVTEISRLEEADLKAEHVALAAASDGYFIEAYIPIRARGEKQAVLAVVEFYTVPTALEATIREGRKVIWWSALLGGLILYLGLYWIVDRSALLIERQQHDLARMEAFAAIGQMASAVAHSLRNPMSAIRSTAELWKSEQAPDDTHVTGDIIREIDRMDGYVRDLLAYTRSEKYQLQTIDPVEAIHGSLRKLEPALKRNNIETQIQDKRREPRRVLGDQALLSQALTSILTNSVEAMSKGGTLEVDIFEAPSTAYVCIHVKDTGKGIPPHLLSRITESYFTTKSRGLGIGLTLAKGIIERFSGKLDIKSQLGSGTTVAISLKAA